MFTLGVVGEEAALTRYLASRSVQAMSSRGGGSQGEARAMRDTRAVTGGAHFLHDVEQGRSDARCQVAARLSPFPSCDEGAPIQPAVSDVTRMERYLLHVARPHDHPVRTLIRQRAQVLVRRR